MSKSKKPGAKRRWVKNLYRSKSEQAAAATDGTPTEPSNRLLQAGLAVVRRIDRVLPIRLEDRVERLSSRVETRVERVTDRLANLRDDVRKKVDAITALVRRSPPPPAANPV